MQCQQERCRCRCSACRCHRMCLPRERRLASAAPLRVGGAALCRCRIPGGHTAALQSLPIPKVSCFPGRHTGTAGLVHPASWYKMQGEACVPWVAQGLPDPPGWPAADCCMVLHAPRLHLDREGAGHQGWACQWPLRGAQVAAQAEPPTSVTPVLGPAACPDASPGCGQRLMAF